MNQCILASGLQVSGIHHGSVQDKAVTEIDIMLYYMPLSSIIREIGYYLPDIMSEVKQNPVSGLINRMNVVLGYNSYCSLNGGDTQAEGNAGTDAENCVSDNCCCIVLCFFRWLSLTFSPKSVLLSSSLSSHPQ